MRTGVFWLTHHEVNVQDASKKFQECMLLKFASKENPLLLMPFSSDKQAKTIWGHVRKLLLRHELICCELSDLTGFFANADDVWILIFTFMNSSFKRKTADQQSGNAFRHTCVRKIMKPSLHWIGRHHLVHRVGRQRFLLWRRVQPVRIT